MSDYYQWQGLASGQPTLLASTPENPFGQKGIVLNVPPQLLADGTLLDAQNMIPTLRGLKRRPGTAPFTASAILDFPIQDAIGFWKVTGTQDLLVLGKQYLYKAAPTTGYSVVRDQWEIGGRVTVSGTAVTGIKTKFLAAGVQAGQYLIIDADGSGGAPTICLIQSVNSETSITLSTTGGTYASPTDFKISRLFSAANPWFVDWTVVTGGTPRVLFADGIYPLRGYDGTTLEDYGLVNTGTISIGTGTAALTGVGTSFVTSGVIAGDLIVCDWLGNGSGPEVMVIQTVNSDTSLTLTGNVTATYTTDDYRIIQVGRPKAHCVAYHKDRVWEGNTLEGGNQYRQRIRWTATGDLDNFTLGGWIDLPYVQGAIKKLVPLGDFLVAYFDDAVFIGRPSSLGTNPFSFQQVETGGIGLLGMKAVQRYLDGHFVVGQDDIYLLTSSGIQPIGSPVVRRTIQECGASHHWMIQVAVDQRNERVIFGFPKSGDEMEELWSYSYKAQSWAYDKITCQCLSSNSYVAALTWDTFVATAYSTGTIGGGVGASAATGSGTVWSAGNCAHGDSILIDIDGDGNYEFSDLVNVFSDGTHFTIQGTFPSTFSGKNYRLVKAAGTWNAIPYATWDSMGSIATTLKDVYIGKVDNLWKYDTSLNTDNGSAIPIIIVTKDYNINEPDKTKFFGYLAMKMETWNDSDADIIFNVEGSTDRGQNWKNLKTLKIPINQDEGDVHFRMIGSIIRFRLTSTSISNSYVITETMQRGRMVGSRVPGRGDK